MTDEAKMMQELRASYVNTFPQKLHDLIHLIEEVKDKKDVPALSALRLQVHKLAGSSGTYGFGDISLLCRDFEKSVIEQINQAKVSPAWPQEAQSFLERLKGHFNTDVRTP